MSAAAAPTSDPFALGGRKAIVTGGGGDIGGALAEALFQSGADVAIVGRGDGLGEAAARMGSARRPVHAVRGDLTDRKALQPIFDEAVGKLDGLDILVASHGFVKAGNSIDYDMAAWDETVEANLNSAFRLCQLAGERMIPQGRGKIITIASMLSFSGGLRAAAYAASKGGLAQLTKALANEWAPKGINVNAIAPGYIQTKMNRHIWQDASRNQQILARLPSGRWGAPADLKGAVVFLASAASDYVHGIVLPIDGGFLAQMTTGGRIGVGIDSFSYHRYFGEVTRWETPLGLRWDTTDFLGRAHALGVGAVSLQTVYLPELTGSALVPLRRQLDALGLQPVLAWGHPDGLQGGASPDRVDALRRLLHVANDLGCAMIRLVCGNQFTRTPSTERIARLTPILRELSGEAAALGLTLAVENHADFAMRDLVALIEAVGNERLGICFDTGNAVRVGDDLPAAAALAAPFVKMVHLKDMIVIPESRSDPTLWWPAAPLGRGHFDIPAFVDVLRAANFAGNLFIEMANMHPDWPDEDSAVAESVVYLKDLLGRA